MNGRRGSNSQNFSKFIVFLQEFFAVRSFVHLPISRRGWRQEQQGGAAFLFQSEISNTESRWAIDLVVFRSFPTLSFSNRSIRFWGSDRILKRRAGQRRQKETSPVAVVSLLATLGSTHICFVFAEWSLPTQMRERIPASAWILIQLFTGIELIATKPSF